MHDDFIHERGRNDIAPLKLPKSIDFNDNLKPIQFSCRDGPKFNITEIGNGKMETEKPKTNAVGNQTPPVL